MKYKYACGFIPGNSGSQRVTEIQDKGKITEENGVVVLSLADTAGRIENPDFRTNLIEEAAAVLMTERFDEFYASKDSFVQKEILKTLGETSQKKGMKPSALDSALLFVAVKENRYLAGHLGGGLIAGLNEGCAIISKPQPESRDITNLRIYRGELQESYGFMLVSDGASKSLYNSSTDSLSPACGTFFEWLKEYDEEAVSEALTENIGKYFLKDAKGDIGVCVMVSDIDDTEPDPVVIDGPVEPEEPIGAEESIVTEEPVATEEPGESDEPVEADELDEPNVPVEQPAGDSDKKRKLMKYLIAIIVVLAAIYVCTLIPKDAAEQNDILKADPKPPVTDSAEPKQSVTDSSDSKLPVTDSPEYEPSVTFSVGNPEAFEVGEYEIGSDIPAGEYFFWTGEMLKPGSIEVNGEPCLSGELYCMTIQVEEGDTLVSDIRFTPADNVNPIKSTNGLLISGKYRIGKDIAPGTYKISPTEQNTEGKYYSILDGEISNDDVFRRQTTVVVPEEGYIVFYNAALEVEAK